MQKDNTNYTVRFSVDKAPAATFRAINNVRGWWSSKLEGQTENLDDEFVYKNGDMHYSRQRVVEMVPDKQIAWLVSDSRLSFANPTNEWDGTKISFQIEGKGDKSDVIFTHYGLTPHSACFEMCTGGWRYYLYQSLIPLINDGTGKPD